MKKKILFALIALAFAVAIGGSSVAMVSTANALSVPPTVVEEQTAEGEDVVTEAAADAYGVTYTSSYITQTLVNNYPTYNVAYNGTNPASSSYQTITLPAGEYTLEAWGGSGGGGGVQPSTYSPDGGGNTANATYQGYANTYGNTKWQTLGSRGGAGGYVASTLKLTSATTLYLYVGGQGIYATGRANATGGWNGGAAGSTSANGGGGGASDIRIGGTTLYYRVLVAGGGGGADNAAGNRGPSSMGGSDDGSGGAGGGATAERPFQDGVYVGSAATQTAGYSFGTGATPTASTDTGGAGGGWYGGYCSNHNNGGAGGGSSYILTSSSTRPSGYAHSTSSPYNMTALRNYLGIWNGNGKIRITMNDTPPVTKNATVASVARGTATAAIAPSTLAQDLDTFNTMSWAETCSASQNAIYTNSACTTRVGTDVMTVSGMTAGSTGNMTITPKKFITAGTTFYVKIKDQLNLTGVIAFKFGTTDNALNKLSAATVVDKSATSGRTNDIYVVGDSNTADESVVKNNFTAATSRIYNPSGTGRYTVFIPKPIVAGKAVTIDAASLFSDLDYSHASKFDDIVVTSIKNASTTAYTVTGNGNLTGRGYTSVTVSHNAAATMSGYINSVVLTVQSVEKSTNLLMGSAQTIEVVFKIDNTRPTLPTVEHTVGGATFVDYFLKMNVGTNVTVNVGDICTDPDGNRLEIKEVKVPTKEFIPLDKYGNVLTLDTRSNYSVAKTGNTAVTDSLKTGEGSVALNFESSSIVAATHLNTEIAYVSYTISADGQSLTLQPLRATRNQYDNSGRVGHFYFLVRVEDKGDSSDEMWYPIAVEVVNTKPTQPAPAAIADSANVTINDANVNTYEVIDGVKYPVAYFSPMGIGTLDMADVKNPDKQLPGIAEDRDVFGVSSYDVTASAENCMKMYNEFLLFDFGSMLSAGETKIVTPYYIIEKRTIYAHSVTVAKIAGTAANGFYGSASASGMVGWGRYSELGSDIKVVNNETVSFDGLKVTFLRSTNGYYIQQPIVVKDTRGETSSSTSFANDASDTVNLLIKVANNPITQRTSTSTATATTAAERGNQLNTNIIANYAYNDTDDNVRKNATEKVKVAYVTEGVNKYIDYTVPSGFTFTITPYDIANDIDLLSGWLPNVNTNPNLEFTGYNGEQAQYSDSAAYTEQYDASFVGTSLFITKNAADLATSASALTANTLYFTESPAYTNSSAANISGTNERSGGGYDRITVSARSRTSSANPVTMVLKVSDGEDGLCEIRVRVHISNNAPKLRTSATNVFYLSSNYQGVNENNTNSSDDYNMSGNYSKPSVDPNPNQNMSADMSDKNLYNIAYNVRELAPSDLAADYDSADSKSLTFASVVVYYYTMRNGEFVALDNGSSYVEATFTQASGSRETVGQVLKLTAVASTQNLEGGLYIGVKITDGYGTTNVNDLDTIKIQVEVVNSAPAVNKDAATGFTYEKGTDDSGAYTWSYVPNEPEDLSSDKYLVSDSRLYDALINGAVSENNKSIRVDARNMRLLGMDNDLNQQMKLYVKDAANDKGGIPLYALDNAEGNRYANETNGYNDVAITFTSPFDGINASGTPPAATVFDYVSVVYFAYDTSNQLIQIPTPYDAEPNGQMSRAKSMSNIKSYSENVYWAIKINSSGRSFPKAMNFKVYVRDTADTARAGMTGYTEKGYNGSRENTTRVYGTAELSFSVKIGTTGMTVTHEKFTDGFYTYKDSSGQTQSTSFEYRGLPLSTNGSAKVPLSYFAYLTNLIDASSNGVAYASTFGLAGTSTENATDAAKNAIFENISLTDGITTWSGATLNTNPYLYFNPYGTTKALASDTHTEDYLNRVLNFPSKNENGDTDNFSDLFENWQGLNISARGPRNGSTPLKLTLDLGVYDINNKVLQLQEDGSPTTAKATIDVTIKNSDVQITNGNGGKETASVTTGNNIPNGNYTSYTFRLANSASAGTPANVFQIYYKDENKISKTDGITSALLPSYQTRYCDTANFMFSSLGTTSSVLTKAQLEHMLNANGTMLSNTWRSDSINNGFDDLVEYLGLQPGTTTIDPDSIDFSALNPNKGYDQYFTIDPGADGDSFTIRLKNKTMFHNDDGMSLKDEAESRGLIYENGVIYFPLKVIVYDTYNGSVFSSSTWQLLTIKVIIQNTNPSVNNAFGGNSENASYPIELTMGNSYSLYVADIISDSDCVRAAGNARYMTKKELIAAGYKYSYESGYDKDKDLGTTDWLLYTEYPIEGNDPVALPYTIDVRNKDGFGYCVFNNSNQPLTESESSVKVSVDAYGRITYTATKRTLDPMYVEVHFQDCNGAVRVFRTQVSIVNSAPELLHKYENDVKQSDFFYENSSSPEIVMRTGDYFDVVVTPYDFYENSYSGSLMIGSVYDTSYRDFTYEYLSSHPFCFDASAEGAPAQKSSLGTYVVADDDSPSSLSLSIPGGFSSSALTVNPDKSITVDGKTRTLSYRIKAEDVSNGKIPVTFNVTDSGSKTISITMQITVISTPPTILTPADIAKKLPGVDINPITGNSDDASSNDVTLDDLREGRVFAVNMQVGDSITFKASDFCSDSDGSDVNYMYLYKAFSGSAFAIGGNESGVTSSSYVSITFPKETITDGKNRSFTLTADNFKSGTGKDFEQVVFYVMDPSGSSLETDAVKVILNVKIAPRAITNNAASTLVGYEVGSKKQYSLDQTASKLTVVRDGKAAGSNGYIIDPDYNSNNQTSYTAKVYALYNLETKTNIEPTSFATYTDKSAYLLKSYDGNATTVSENEALLDYVGSYFEFDFDSDGASLNFVPTNATLNTAVRLYVELIKRNVESNGSVVDAKYKSGAYFGITVKNSTPEAVGESAANSLYFSDGGSFLHFTGHIGDERTYYMQDAAGEEGVTRLGLFSDPDTNDVISYFYNRSNSVGWEVIGNYEDNGEQIVTETGANAPWRANSLMNLSSDAFVITRTNDNSAITIRFMRKVNATVASDKDSVKIPIRIYARDSVGQEVSTVIVLKICNSEPTVKEVLPSANQGARAYTLQLQTQGAYVGRYVLEASLEYGKSLTVNLSDIYEDRDTRSPGSMYCDSMSFVGDSDLYLSDISRNPAATHSVKGESGKELFTIKTTSSENTSIRIECKSTHRGDIGYAYLWIADSNGAKADEIVIMLTVANTAPQAKSENMRIDMLGNDAQAVSKDVNILDYVTDINDYDMRAYNDVNLTAATRSYVRISAVSLGDTSVSDNGIASPDGAIWEQPELSAEDKASGVVYANVVSCTIDFDEGANTQKFTLQTVPGVYGWQKLFITVIDDGDVATSTDALPHDIVISVYVARPPTDIVPKTIERVLGRGDYVTASNILDGAGSHNSEAYKLEKLELGTGASGIVDVYSDTNPLDNSTRWGVRSSGSRSGVTAKVVGVFSVGDIRDLRVEFDVRITDNQKPELDEAKFPKNSVYSFYTRDEDSDGLIRLSPTDIFRDPDRDQVDMTFVSVKSSIDSVCDARIDAQSNKITLRFIANREVELTIQVKDEVNLVEETIIVSCADKDDLGFFASTLVYIKSNLWLVAIAAGLLLLLIIILLIIILAVRKKRRMRKELEALLVSEMEMEEQMLKLSSSQNTAAYYNSFGYLPPTQQGTNAPLLGQGGAPGTPPGSGAIGLNPGSQPPNPPQGGDNGGGFNGDNF